MGKTIIDKIWEKHVVASINDGPDVLYIDKNFVHEVTSPQAFAGLEKRKIKVFRPERTIATADHNVPTKNQHLPIKEEQSRLQVEKLTENCKKFGVNLFGLLHPFQGIVHVIGPELGFTQPGMTIVCGDSHTSTHGAFGAIAFGVGTSEVEEVLATQCLLQTKPKSMKIQIDGKPGKGVTSKDIILYVISKLTTGGGSGYFVEFTGSAIKELSMEARMTICNMGIEMGAKGSLIAPDETTFEYVKNRKFAPKGKKLEKAIEYWKTLKSDDDAVFDKEYFFDAADIEPMITFGTNPGMAIKINEPIPFADKNSDKTSFEKALEYMGFKEGEKLIGKKINYVFIGSCTNGRIEDIRIAAAFIKGKKKADNVRAMVVPGSMQVLKQAKEEGLDKIFTDAGIDFREPGCSACLAMNEDKVPAGEYCVATSNRNFEGRQGPGARTILASPLTAAAVAIKGEITDVREGIS
ncbi:MAG: 3-isopropylmalate dehydratase large subunit [Bacteroidales bacterium]|nr:3-isopropylmalate dehydratase large subunit [Bacteroidales bacterium]